VRVEEIRLGSQLVERDYTGLGQLVALALVLTEDHRFDRATESRLSSFEPARRSNLGNARCDRISSTEMMACIFKAS
jgi:hypothetical protein